MDKSEFDKFAEEYEKLHAQNIKASGEEPAFFHEYKVRDVEKACRKASVTTVSRILDLGSGVGNSIPYFGHYFPDSSLTCLDVSRKSLLAAETRFPGNARFVEFDGREIPFPGDHFDLVFSACVFHHIAHEEHLDLLRECHRVLRPGGITAIFEHNPYNPLTVRAVNTCPFDENAVLVRPSALVRRMRNAGYPRATVRYTIFFPASLRGLRPLEPFLAWLPLGAQYYVAASKN